MQVSDCSDFYSTEIHFRLEVRIKMRKKFVLFQVEISEHNEIFFFRP